MNKNFIQFPRYVIKKSKPEAIVAMTNYINLHLSEFKDGEEIVIRYQNEFGEISSVNAIVDIYQGVASLSVEINEHDTVKIVESDTEPEDKNSLWLTDADSGETTEGLIEQVNSLKKELKSLKDMLEKHDYALSNTIAGGDIITNSEKYDRENENTTEQPEDAIDYGTYAEDDFIVASFGLYIANTKFSEYSAVTPLYRGQNYYLKFRFFNSKGETIRYEDATGFTGCYISSSRPEVADLRPGKDEYSSVLTASKKGSIELSAEVELDSGAMLIESMPLNFKVNEEPYYEKYGEPNVHHMLIKSVETYDILTANTDYLCTSEFIWCVGNNTLYLKAKTTNGSIQVIKISGNGGSITGDTGTTAVTISYTIDETTKNLVASGETISIDENGILVLPNAELDENGIVHLTNITGSTTGGTSSVTFNIDTVTGILNATGESLSLSNGILSINNVTKNENNEIILNNKP